MKKVFILFISIFFLNPRSVSKEDKVLEILYICNLEGDFQFDQNGRKGLATIAEVKRQRSELLFDEDGLAVMVSNGNFFEKGHTWSHHLMKKSGFDMVFFNSAELEEYYKNNPNLLQLNLPIYASYQNQMKIPQNKEFTSGNIKFEISSIYSAPAPEKKLSIQLVFLPENEPIPTIKTNIPVIFFISDKTKSPYTYQSNVYTANCPSKTGKLGKLDLYFRKGELIRQYNDMIHLNTEDHNHRWFPPAIETQKELQ